MTNAFQKILNESNCKPDQIWVDKTSEFYNRSMKSWLEKNYIEIYSTHNEGKSVVAERFTITLKNKIYKNMTSMSIYIYIYIYKLDDIVNKYNNTYHITIKMKLVDVKSSTFINSSKEINDEVPKLKISDLLKYQNIKTFLQKVPFQICPKKFFLLKI